MDSIMMPPLHCLEWRCMFQCVFHGSATTFHGPFLKIERNAIKIHKFLEKTVRRFGYGDIIIAYLSNDPCCYFTGLQRILGRGIFLDLPCHLSLFQFFQDTFRHCGNRGNFTVRISNDIIILLIAFPTSFASYFYIHIDLILARPYLHSVRWLELILSHAFPPFMMQPPFRLLSHQG